jgi:uncharacterized protein (UPF0335 family)
MHEDAIGETMLTAKDVLYCSDVLDQFSSLIIRMEEEKKIISNKEVKNCFNKTQKGLTQAFADVLTILEEEL